MRTETQDIDRKLEEWAVPLRQLLEQEEAALMDARAEVKRREARIKRIERTLRAMEPEANKQPPRPKGKRSTNDWRPNAEALKQVKAALDEAEEGMTAREIAEATKLSASTIGRALHVLRADESIRLAGKRSGGRGTAAPIYRSMGVSSGVA